MRAYGAVRRFAAIDNIGEVGALAAEPHPDIHKGYLFSVRPEIHKEVSAAVAARPLVLLLGDIVFCVHRKRADIVDKGAPVRGFGIVAEGLAEGADGTGFPKLIGSAPARKAELGMAGRPDGTPRGEKAVVFKGELLPRRKGNAAPCVQPRALKVALGVVQGGMRTGRRGRCAGGASFCSAAPEARRARRRAGAEADKDRLWES